MGRCWAWAWAWDRCVEVLSEVRWSKTRHEAHGTRGTRTQHAPARGGRTGQARTQGGTARARARAKEALVNNAKP